MKGMLRGKKKKETVEKDPPELFVDGQPFSNPNATPTTVNRRPSGGSNDEALTVHRNSMFSMQPLNILLGRNKLLSAFTTVSTAPSPLGTSAPASYMTQGPMTAESQAVTLVRRASNRLMNSARFSSYETLRTNYNADAAPSPRFSRSTENLVQELASLRDTDIQAGPLIPSASDPGGSRKYSANDINSEDEVNHLFKRRQQQQCTTQGNETNRYLTLGEDQTALDDTQNAIQNVNITGYLAKKTDFRGGWKVYEANMRGGKLYFYKPASQASKHQISDTDGKGMALQVVDFDPAASAFLFEPSPAAPLVTQYHFGLKVTELEVTSMRFRRYACVLLFEERIVICRRKWIRSSRAQASAMLSSDDDNANGYYTKWKMDDNYPIQHVEVMEAASTGFDSQSPMAEVHPTINSSMTNVNSSTAAATTSNDNSWSSKHHRRASSSGKDIAPLPTQLGFQMFVSSRDEVAAPTTFSSSPIIRLFVARTDDARRTFIKKLQEKREAWHQRQKQQIQQQIQQRQQQQIGDEIGAKQLLPRTSTEIGRKRRFWGTQRHPELTVEMCDANTDTADGASKKKYRIMGGSVDALLHELIHQTGRADEEEVNPDEFLASFLASYHLFTDSIHLLQELNRYASNAAKDATDTARQPVERVAYILRTWIKRDETLLDDMAVREFTTLLDDVLSPRGIQDTADIKDILVKRRKETTSLNSRISEAARKQSGKSHVISSVDLSNLTVTGLSPAIFLKLDPTEFAHQICIYHLQQLQRNNPMYVSNFILSREASSSCDAFSFTPAKPHFLTRLLLDHLLDGGQSMTVIRRAITLNHWIRVGIASWELGDSAGWAAIALGICSPGVTRLRETWREVDPVQVQYVREKWVPELLDMGLFESETEKTTKAVQLHQGQSNARVPYLGAVQQAVMRLNESLSDRLTPPVPNTDEQATEPDESISRSASGRVLLVNFDKYRQMYRVHENAVKHLPRLSVEMTNTQWPASAHPALQDYMAQLAARDVEFDAARYFSASLQCEYGLDGHYYDVKPALRPTRLNAILAPLSFVDPLPDTPLLYLASVAPQTLATRTNNMASSSASTPINTNSSGRRSLDLGVRSTFMRTTSSSSSTSNTNNTNNNNNGKSPPHTPKSHNDTASNLLSTSPGDESFFDADSLMPRSPRGSNSNNQAPNGWWGALRGQRGSLSSIQNDRQESEFGVWLDTGDLYASVRVQPSGTSQRPLIAKTPTSEVALSPSDSFVLGITVIGGAPERLIEVLIYGLPAEADRLVDELSRPLTTGLRGLKVEFDHTDYTRMFFATFRSFCSPTWLFEQLVRRFVDAETALETNKIHNAPVTATNANTTKPLISLANRGRLQRTVLQICASWLDQYFTDVLDSPKLRRRVTRLMLQAIKESTRFTQESDATLQRIGFEIKSTATVTLNWILRKTLEPAIDTTLVNLEQQYPMHHPDLDKELPRAILTSLNAAAAVLFRQISLADWVQAVTVLELQTLDPLVWHPTQRRPVPLEEELTLPDIFTVLDHSRRAGTTSRILTALPWSIQKCCQFRDRLRTWVISRVTSTSAQWNQRVEWISKFLQMIALCRGTTHTLILSPDATTVDAFGGTHRVPSLVERAIASALVSPESRLFLRTWQEVAARRNTTLDTLTLLIMSETAPPSKAPGMTRSGTLKGSSRSRPMTLVPCIGWAMESILQICYRLPDTLPDTTATSILPTGTTSSTGTSVAIGITASTSTSTNTATATTANTITAPIAATATTAPMVSLEKRLRLHNMIDILRQYQAQMEKAAQQQPQQPLTACAFLMTPDALTLQSNWRPLRELSQQESLQVSKQSIQHHPRLHKTTRVFHKLLGEQQDKLRRDNKERDRLEKELHDMTMQHRRQSSLGNNNGLLPSSPMAGSTMTPGSGLSGSPEYRSSTTGKMKGMMRLVKGVIGTSNTVQPSMSTSSGGNMGSASGSSRPLVGRVSSLSHASKPMRKGSNRPSAVINLINAQAQVEHGYAKRPHVFRVITEEGGQHLLQAADRPSMQQWLEAIAHVSRTAAIKRRSTQPENSDPLPVDVGSAPPVPSLPGQGLRTPMFGIDLEPIMIDDQLPIVVEKCIAEVERRGLEEVGIYRVPGMQSAMDRLRNCFNQDATAVDLSTDDWADINVVACLLKQFFRELPEPLLTNRLYDEFIKATKIEEYNDRMFALKDLLAMLPRRNYILFRRLVEHLERVTEFEESNHMYATNLAIVFGPSLIRAPPGPANFGASFNNLGHHQNIVKTYILQYHWFFDVEDEPEESQDNAEENNNLDGVIEMVAEEEDNNEDDDDDEDDINQLMNRKLDKSPQLTGIAEEIPEDSITSFVNDTKVSLP